MQEAKRYRFDPWVRKIPWRRAWQPTPGFLPGEFPGQKSFGLQSIGSQRVRHDWSDLAHHYVGQSEFAYILTQSTVSFVTSFQILWVSFPPEFFFKKQHLNLTSVHLSYYLFLSSMIFMPLGAYELFMHPYAFLPTSPCCVLSEKLWKNIK